MACYSSYLGLANSLTYSTTLELEYHQTEFMVYGNEKIQSFD
jgi:hypothetical protein